MEVPSGRVYRRHKRRLACKYCSTRHIRCKTPEPSRVGAGEKSGNRWCQACTDANEVCELGISSGTTSIKPSDNSRGVALSDQQQLPPPFRNSSDSNPKHRQGQLERVNCLLSVEELKEGTEMLLVRLMDAPEYEDKENVNSFADKVIYFGNNSVWSYAIRKACSSSLRQPSSTQTPSAQSPASSMHYQIPKTLDQRPHDIPGDDLGMKDEETSYLRKKGAFSLPPVGVQKSLLEAYFRWIFPIQQILDREQFLRDHKSGRASILLLQTLFFVATTCCDQSIIRANWGTRRSAQLIFFKRAKALYHADYEQNRVTTIQALFLMSFWWSSPMDEKDCSHWLGAAIRFAQANGMHRSTINSNMSINDRRLWKRIWWALYVRDRCDAASLGRPKQIHDDDCDVEWLDATDFEEVENHTTSYNGPVSFSVGHSIEMAHLAVLLGQIIKRVPHNTTINSCAEQMNEKLSAWEKGLPENLRYHEDERNQEAKLFAAMLCMNFHLCKIMLSRQIFLETNPGQESCSVAPASANVITRIIEDLLAEDLLRRAHVHVIPSLFACLTDHVTSLRQSEGPRRRVLQHKTQLCVLGLVEFKDSWPFAGWIYRLFRSLLERLQAEDGEFAHRDFDFQDSTSISRSDENGTSILDENATMAAQHDGATIPLSFGRLGASSSGDFQTASSFGDQPSTIFDSFGNFLDPFVSLQSLDCYGQHTEPSSFLEADIWA